MLDVNITPAWGRQVPEQDQDRVSPIGGDVVLCGDKGEAMRLMRF
jgi:hypothetical protein